MRGLPSPKASGFGPEPGCQITLRFLVGLLSCLWLVPVTFGSSQKEKTSDIQRATASITGNVNLIMAEGQANNLAGVTVKLSDSKTGSASQSTLADESGHFQFMQLAAGTYTLDISAEGFKKWVKTITLGQGQAAAEDVTLEINSVEQQIEVQGEGFEISTNSAEPAATLSNQELDTLPLAQQKFTDALPLTPGVIRTPEGKLNFNGQAENQGILLVNSTENVDPVTGSFAIPVPVDVIQSMSVHSTPDTAEFGGFSGALTQIETRPPFDAWDFKLHDFIPGIRGKSGQAQRSGSRDSTGEAQMGRKGCLPLFTRMARSLCAISSAARRVPPHHCVFICRVQMQSRLLVLLGLRQQGQRHDGRRGPALDRLAARQWLQGARVNGW